MNNQELDFYTCFEPLDIAEYPDVFANVAGDRCDGMCATSVRLTDR